MINLLVMLSNDDNSEYELSEFAKQFLHRIDKQKKEMPYIGSSDTFIVERDSSLS